MKLNSLKTLFLLLGASSALSAVAYDVKVDGFYYNLDKSNNSATLTYLLFYSPSNSAAYVGDIVIPETFEHDGITYTVTAVDGRAFFACNQLTSIELPSTITQIGSNAFINCTNLKSVKFPDGLKTIDNAAFLGCSSLESVELPSSLITLGSAAFSGCTSLKNLVLPKFLRKIDSNTFLDCYSITHLELPGSLSEIGLLAFSGCTGLESIVFPESLKDIKVNAFQNCSNLKKIELGSAIHTLDTQCFSGCSSLEDVYCTAPKSPTETFSNAFTGTPRLRLHVPNASIEAYHKVDTWAAFKSILPIQCATPSFTLDGQNITFTTATNLNYTSVKEQYTYSIEVSDLSNGIITDEEMEAFGGLQLTYDVRVKATAEGCDDSEEVAAQASWIDFKLVATDSEDGGTTAIDAPSVQRPVLATSRGGEISLSGLADGERVVLYDLSGRQIGTTTASGGSANFSAASGQIVVVRVAGSSFKIRVN